MELLLKDKKILFCGASGVSGQAALRLALALGARVCLSDTKTSPPRAFILENLSPSLSIEEREKNLIDLRPRQDPQILSEYDPDMLVFAPGLPPQLEILQRVSKQGALLLPENDFGFQYLLEIYKQKKRKKVIVIGITGTDGKSSTTALLSELINASTGLSSAACGNFALPLSHIAYEAIAKEIFYEVLVVECSSFQLEALRCFHPQISLFLNLARDHADRYKSMEDYFQAKLQITKLQNEEDLLILAPNLKKRVLQSWQRERGKRKYPRLRVPSLPKGNRGTKKHSCKESSKNGKETGGFYFLKQPLLTFSEYKLPGLHNRKNASFALAALEELSSRFHIKLKRETLRKTLLSFRGLPHRLEYAGKIPLSRGCDLECYNDSKATTVQAIRAALQSFSTQTQALFLLCGGRNKGDDFSVLGALDFGMDLELFSFGEAGAEIAEQVKGGQEASYRALGLGENIYRCLGSLFRLPARKKRALLLHEPSPDLKRAFAQALNRAEEYRREAEASNQNGGKTLSLVMLLSPGCSSFDAYENYKQRGERFCQLVHQRSEKEKGEGE